jgi:lactam utilization protein B
VHGDNPAALELVSHIRKSLREAGVEIAPPATFL